MALDGAIGKFFGKHPVPTKKRMVPRLYGHMGEEELVVLGNGRAYGYDLQEGKELWYVNGFPAKPSPFPSWMRSDSSCQRLGGRGRR